MAKSLKSAGLAWIERTNPLRGLSIREAQTIFDSARGGDTQRLHWIFQEIESVNPVLMTCVERRASALAGLGWNVAARPGARDRVLADEQRDAVEDMIGDIENFTELVEHLDLAFFRGFSFAQPLWEADGSVRQVALLDSWQFLHHGGRLYFNPECTGFSGGAVEVLPEAGLVSVGRRRCIDYPALSIHIREAVGERDWGRFLERIALPKPAVIMAPGANDQEKAAYVAAAEDVEDGRVSVWPNGASLTDFMGQSRSQDPFSAFVRHQDERVVLLATGGTLTSLAAADTGALAGGAQMDVWREIVARDAATVERAIVRSLVAPFLSRRFPGRPACVAFSFDRSRKPTATEAAQTAATLRTAGWRVDRAELEAATGFTLEEAPDLPANEPLGGAFARHNADASFKTAFNRVEKRAAASGRTTRPKTGDAREGAFLDAFAEDASEAATRVRELLDDPTPEAARRLLDDLPSLIPDDPALAAVIAEEMAKSFADAFKEEQVSAVASDCHAQDPAHCPVHGVPKTATDDEVASFQRNLPRRISPDTADALLTHEFTDTDADGNSVLFGKLLKEHLERDAHSDQDVNARKQALGAVVEMIRSAKPLPSKNPKRPHERIYFGWVGEKAYISIADQHNEINAMMMVSYRRDGRRDKR